MISDTTKSRPPYNATAHMDITYFAGKRALEISKMFCLTKHWFFFLLKLVKQSIYRSLRFQWYLFVGHGRTMWKVYHSCGHAELKFWTLSSRKNDFRLVGYGANTLLELPGFCPCGRNMKEKYCPLLPSSCTDSFSFICPEPQLPAYSQFSLKLAPAP